MTCDLRPLGLGGGIFGLSPRVHSSPAILSGSHSNPPPSGSCSTGSAPSGDQVLDSQGRSGAPRRSRAGGLLLYFLPHNEEIRRVEAHTQPQAPQPFHSPSSLLHGNFDSGNQSTAAGLVGRHFRPSRRLPPCSRSQILPEMAAFRCGSLSLPVPSPPLWSLNCPRTFTRVVKVVAEYLRRKGKSIFVYLDDWLLVAPSPQLLQSFLAEVIRLGQSLGFIVNMDKSSLVPSQSPLFLDFCSGFQNGPSATVGSQGVGSHPT